MNNRLSELPLAIGELVQLHRLGLKVSRCDDEPCGEGCEIQDDGPDGRKYTRMPIHSGP